MYKIAGGNKTQKMGYKAKRQPLRFLNNNSKVMMILILAVVIACMYWALSYVLVSVVST